MKQQTKEILIYILVAYIFSLGIRYIYIDWAKDIPEFYWNNQIMINNNDGYYFGSIAQHYLYGMHSDNPRMTGLFDSATVFFSYLAVKLFPFLSLDTVMLYMPGVVSSLVVIPIILIAREFGSSLWGFFAALIGSITWSYYNRTMFGYYDTDMFSAMMPMFILYFLIKTIRHKDYKDLFISAILVLSYPFFYDQGLSIVYAMSILFMLYLVFFNFSDKFTYKAIFVLSVALFHFNILLVLILFLLAFYISTMEFTIKPLRIFAFISFILFLYFGDVFGLIWGKVAEYAIRGVEAHQHLHFFNVNATVREAGKIPFWLLADRISGSVWAFYLSIAGYLLLIYKRREFILSLPLVGIGLFAYFGGLRFTVYAVPVMALSIVYLFYFISSFIKQKYISIALMAGFSFAVLYPNITHIIGYKTPTVFLKDEVAVLDKLKHISNDKDYTLTWWDYGYPIWYYSNTNTLIDGGKHNDDNFIISKILTSNNQLQSAQLARISVELYAKTHKVVADQLFEKQNPNKFLESLKSPVSLPKKTRDIYLFLPYKMMNIFGTISIFSNLDLVTGKQKRPHYMRMISNFRIIDGNLVFGRNYLRPNGKIHLNNQDFYINSIDIVEFSKKGFFRRHQTIDKNSPLHVVFMKSYGRVLLLDDYYYNSSFVQMFVFDNYNKKLFEPVILNPMLKIYKVK